MQIAARRAAALAALTAVVLLWHGALLQALLGSGRPAAHRPSPTQARVQVRRVEPAPAPARPAAAPAPAPKAPPRTTAAAAPPIAGVEAPAPDAVLPVYPTRLAPPVHWAYTVRRGDLTGGAELRWQPGEHAYEARLAVRTAQGPLLEWASRGGFDAAGVAPERFVARGRQRSAAAANFQRAAGKITYAGPSLEHSLPQGAQDRLSWLFQLPGIVAATPERFAAAGAQIRLFVTGARGDADVWTFVVEGHEAVALPDGASADALKLVRAPLRPYDTRVEVWLDPARHHLPLRVRLATAGRDDVLELLRERDVPPP